MARFEQSYRQVADILRIPGRHDPQVDIFLLVKVWLTRPENGAWLFILDNADDGKIVLGQECYDNDNDDVQVTAPISSHLPYSSHGMIMITTRCSSVAEGLVDIEADIIHLGPMNPCTAVQMLGKRLGTTSSAYTASDLAELAEQLDYMPLALSQATALIKHRAPRMSVTRYLQDLRSDDQCRSKLLQNTSKDPWRDGKASNSIIVTWFKSFEHIRTTRLSASQLLSLMSLFDREGIPEDLLVGQYADDGVDETLGEDMFEDDVAILRDLCLVGISAVDRAFEMHRLVQLSTRQWMSLASETGKWQRRYIGILEKHFPKVNYEVWSSCQKLYPHVTAMTSPPCTDIPARRSYAIVLDRAASYANAQGWYDTAMPMAKTSHTVMTEVADVTDNETLASMNTLGVVLLALGQNAAAETMHQQVVACREKKLGEDHQETLASMTNLGRAFQAQSKYAEAQMMHQQVLERSERSLGAEHVYTITSIHNLARVFQSQGKFAEADKAHRSALEKRERKLGNEHPSTLHSCSDLGRICQARAKYDEAEVMHRRALTGREKILGQDHPHTLRSVHNLARVLQARGKYAEAEAMHRRVLAEREQKMGCDHPDTLASVSNLGRVLQAQGKDAEAEAEHRRAFEARKLRLGDTHIYTISSLNNLACVVHAQKRYEEAEGMHRQALDSRRKSLGDDHPDTLSSLANFGLLLHDMGKYSEAEDMHRQALTGRGQRLGENHRHTLTSAWCLATVLAVQSKWEEARTYHSSALEGLRKQLGQSHPRTVECQEQFDLLPPVVMVAA